jgi:hypothetical protein
VPSIKATGLPTFEKRCAELLASIPWTGSGDRLVWKWMLEAATAHAQYRHSRDEARAFLLEHVTPERCGRGLEGNDLENCLARVWGGQTGSSGIAYASASRWPKAEPSETERIVAQSDFSVTVLRRQSDNRAPDFEFAPYDLLERLYYPKALVCIGSDFYTDITQPLEKWKDKDLFKREFIVPSPMTKRSGKTQKGKDRPRCRDAAANERRWLVIEFDFKKTDDAGKPTIWAPTIERWERQGVSVHDASTRLVRHLVDEHQIPLAMVVHSGGKSLHSWFNVRGLPDAADSPLHKFMSEAARLGCDTKLFQPEQWARFPGGYRPAKQRRQEVIYFNPDACPNQEIHYAEG